MKGRRPESADGSTSSVVDTTLGIVNTHHRSLETETHKRHSSGLCGYYYRRPPPMTKRESPPILP